MSLRDRLAALKKQSGAVAPDPDAAAPAATPPDLAPSVGERLTRLGVARPGNRRFTDQDTADLLGGHVLADGVVCVEQDFPLAHCHGRVVLSELDGAPLQLLHPDAPGIERLLFLDTETTGLAGGTGTLPFLLGLARFVGGSLRLRQYFLTGFKGEAAMLADATRWMAGASHLVTFNGKTFDLPLLVTRCRLARLPADPFTAFGHIDLLHPTRSAFGRVWPDCCLQTAERRLLGFRRERDFPGHLIPQAWSDFVRCGVTSTLAPIVEHNRWDLVSLAALCAALARAYQDPHYGGADPLGIARAHRRRNNDAEACRHLAAREHDLDTAGLLELAALHRRDGRWEEAVAIWARLAAGDVPRAIEHLAKYQEHRLRDYAAALESARRLARLESFRAEHQARIERLLARVGGLMEGD